MTDVSTQKARTVRVVVTLKRGVLDAPGQAICHGLDALGHGGVRAVRGPGAEDVRGVPRQHADRRIPLRHRLREARGGHRDHRVPRKQL
ncbi:MAG: phosphoribosylformylglycinamidine synthase subunit PurS [Bacillati bacterium ANGP1]|uniref:Phosphoribosylformylglycinamidine synthase subunit PurS n=1 Tax=Candidatus Segetimicrobium genomatis TaxID=2569760 RepID=A0A537J410_9BACT|nr:MAG: phosphoribosylformylglycinamidine synthase subunit PurS [Terrabacteria group bacterium ANGP1]